MTIVFIRMPIPKTAYLFLLVKDLRWTVNQLPRLLILTGKGFFFSREYPKGISRSYRCGLRYANKSTALTHRKRSSARSEVARYEHDKSSLVVPKCTLSNIGHALTHATSGVRKTSTLGVDFISSESRVFALYARSISIISTAGTV